MIVDVHGHMSAPERLYAYKANLLAHRGSHGRGGVRVTDDELRAAVTEEVGSFGIPHLDHLDSAGIDLQLISPRPYQMMHSEEPTRIVSWFTEETNNLIARSCELFPDRFAGMAGLPQSPSTQPKRLDPGDAARGRGAGFVGVLLNPDPMEGQGPPLPPLGDRYWYPIYEALVRARRPGARPLGRLPPPCARELQPSLHP